MEQQFPKPIRCGENRIAFIEEEIDDWTEAARVARNNSEAELASTHMLKRKSTSRTPRICNVELNFGSSAG